VGTGDYRVSRRDVVLAVLLVLIGVMEACLAGPRIPL